MWPNKSVYKEALLEYHSGLLCYINHKIRFAISAKMTRGLKTLIAQLAPAHLKINFCQPLHLLIQCSHIPFFRDTHNETYWFFSHRL